MVGKTLFKTAVTRVLQLRREQTELQIQNDKWNLWPRSRVRGSVDGKLLRRSIKGREILVIQLNKNNKVGF